MNRLFILLAGLVSTLLVLSGITWVGAQSIERVRLRHEAQFRAGLSLELTLVTKALRNDLVFGNLRVVRGSLVELADGGIFSGFSVRREGLVVLDANVPADASHSFVTSIPVAFGDGANTESRWGEVVYFTPMARFGAVSDGLKDELVLSVSIAALVTLAAFGCLFLILSRSIGLLAPQLTSVVFQEALPPSDRLTMFIWGPAIAQLKTLALKLSMRRQDVEQARAAAMHTRIAQDLVHDLRTPLGAFERGIESRDWSSFERDRPTMRRALARLHAMVEALRHAELERLVRPEPGSLSFLQILDELTPFAAQRRVTIDGSADVLSCVVDHPKVERAVLNLLRNAIEAADSIVNLSSSTVGRDLSIVVSDDGPGVPAGLENKIFERGWTHAKVGGSGLGLAYARDVARGHGGDVRYTRIGNRTHFRLDLPDVVSDSGGTSSEDLPVATPLVGMTGALLVLLQTAQTDALLPEIQRSWQGLVTTEVPDGPLQVAAVYVHPSRFDEVTERMSTGTPVVFAKDDDFIPHAITQLAKRAKRVRHEG